MPIPLVEAVVGVVMVELMAMHLIIPILFLIPLMILTLLVDPTNFFTRSSFSHLYVFRLQLMAFVLFG